MKFCANCGTKLNETDKFCPNCGKEVIKEEVKEQVVVNNPQVVTNNTTKTDPCAITGFVLALVSTLCCGITATPALVFSIIGLVRVNKNENLNGKGIAIAGIVISAIYVLLSVVLYSLSFSTSFIEGLNI